MKMQLKYYLCSAFIVCFCAWFGASAFAQQGGGSLHGQVTDPSGTAIAGASVIMTPATGSPIVVKSSEQGMYEFNRLAAGMYTLTVSASGFALFEHDNVVIADQPLRLNVS